MLITILAILIGALVVCYAWSKQKMSYFKRAGVPEDPGYFPFGSKPNKDVLTGKIPYLQMPEEIYWKYQDKPFVGMYGFLGNSPNIIINDLELVKRVLIRDFDHFVDRRKLDVAPEANKYLVNMLTQLEGDKWKAMRSTISPVFSSGKLKGFIPQIEKVADDMVRFLEVFATGGLEMNAKEIMTNYNIEVICRTSLGVEPNCFSNSDDDHLTQMVHRIARTGKHTPSGLRASFDMLIMKIGFLFPKIGKFFNISLVDKEAETFIVNIIKSRLEESKKTTENMTPCFIDVFVKALKSNNTAMNDRDAGRNEDELGRFDNDAKIIGTKNQQPPLYSNQEEYEVVLISNLFLLFFSGFDTQSTVLSLVLYHLAKNQEAQEKLYQDVLDVVNDNDGSFQVDYNKLQDMWYLDAFINETLRHFPLAPVERQASKPYKLKYGNQEFTIPKGMIVTVPCGFMMDEKYFKNPNQFDPENFSAENKAARGPYPYFGFGQGPRQCIGKRFGLLNCKIALFRLLLNYKIVPCSKTVDKLIPDPKWISDSNGSNGSMRPIGGIWIKIEKRK